MIEEWLLLAATGLFVFFLFIDMRVTRKIVRAANVRPHIESLRATALSSLLATVGAIVTVVLGFNSLFFLWTDGTRLLQPPIPTLLLLIALAAPSIGKLYLDRLVRQWEREVPDSGLRRRWTDEEDV